MKRLVAAFSLVFGLAVFACAGPEDGSAETEASQGELREQRHATTRCRAERLRLEGCAPAPAYWEGPYVYVAKGVCMQDDDDGAWVQCGAEEEGDYNGGPFGDWKGFDTEGNPMHGPCTAWIPLGAACDGSGGSSSSGGGGGGAGGGRQCKTAGHGRVEPGTCFQEPNWKWYQCREDGTTGGAWGPTLGEDGRPCAGPGLYYQP